MKQLNTPEVNKFHRERIHFDGNREAVIQRDGEKCVMCGMTRAKHKTKFGRDITVDHKDGNGRYADVKNNDPTNLQTLCIPCHAAKDNYNRRLTDIQVINIRHIAPVVSLNELSILYKITPQYAGKLIKFQRRKKYNELRSV